MIEEGMSPEEVVKERNISIQTVLGHLADLFLEGEEIDLRKYISKAHLDRIPPGVARQRKT